MSAFRPNVPFFERLIKATGYSCAGLRAAFKYEQSFRQEAIALLIIVPLAIWLGDSAGEIVLLIGSWLWVMVVELLNSAVEAVVDRIGPEHHELSGRAKDVGSAAVLLSMIATAAVWLVVLL